VSQCQSGYRTADQTKGPLGKEGETVNIELITWRIIGIKPLIQSNPHVMWLDDDSDEDNELSVTKRKKLHGTKSEDFATCEKQLYVNSDGKHYHPEIGFMKGLEMACDQRKVGRQSALTVVSGGAALVEHEFLLYQPDTLSKPKPKLMTGKEWQIDYRRAVNHNKQTSQGGVGVVAIRPKWKQWGGLLAMEVDRDFFPQLDILTELLNVAGHYYGMGVGRKRIMAMERQKPKWSDMGMGRYSAELLNGE
jgi:hypothetical protein